MYCSRRLARAIPSTDLSSEFEKTWGLTKERERKEEQDSRSFALLSVVEKATPPTGTHVHGPCRGQSDGLFAIEEDRVSSLPFSLQSSFLSSLSRLSPVVEFELGTKARSWQPY